jgi:ABC-type nitrate/sulfonate/bicarbonate transport system substrate-binding protein
MTCRWARRGTPVVALFAMLLLTLAGCGRNPPSSGRLVEAATIAAVRLPHSTLIYIAHDQGYFSEEGLKVTILDHLYGKEAMESLLAGKADFATAAEGPIMFAVMKGEKISVIATIQTSTKNEAIVARKDLGIAALSDLKGRRIGVAFGTGADFMLASLLTINRIPADSIRRLDVEPDDNLAALSEGRVDAVATWNPYVLQLSRALGDRGIVFRSGEAYTETFNIAASRKVVQENPGIVNKLLRAVAKAESFVQAHPAKARELVAEAIGMERPLLEELWPLNDFSLGLDQSLLIALEEESRWAVENGLTAGKKAPNYLDYFYLDGLTAVKPEAVRIIR